MEYTTGPDRVYVKERRWLLNRVYFTIVRVFCKLGMYGTAKNLTNTYKAKYGEYIEYYPE